MFYLKKNESKKNGLSAVMGRIQLGKSMSQFSLKLNAEAKFWDVKAGRMSGKTALAAEVNREINRVNLLIHTRYKELKEVHAELSAKDLKDAMQGIASSQDTVLSHFRLLNESVSQRVGIDLSEATEGNYIYAYKWLKDFLREKLNLSDIPFKALNYSFIENFYQYLLVDKQLSVGSSSIYLIYFRKVVRNAVNQGILFRDPFHGFEAQRADVVHKSLTKEELDKFMSTEVKLKQQQVTKDVFLFSVFTGISYVDMKLLRFDMITTEEDGSQWIIAKRHKTKVKYQVRLMDIPLAILKKYKGRCADNKVFPIPRNTTIHYALNTIAQRSGIKKKLSIHMARHSFASLITLSEGVPIETVSKMLGHERITTTQVYAELSLDKIAKDAAKLSRRIANKFTFIRNN